MHPEADLQITLVLRFFAALASTVPRYATVSVVVDAAAEFFGMV